MTTDPTDQVTRSARPRDPGDLAALRRSTTDKHIAGVAGGLARHFDVDPIIIRVALVVLCFFGCAGLILYGAIWLLVPQDDKAEAMIRLDARSRSFLLYVAGAVAILAILGDTLGDFHVPWGLLVVGLIVVLVLGNRQRVQRRARDREAYSVYGTPVATASGVAPDPATSYDYVAPDDSPYSAQLAADVEQRAKQKVDAKVTRYQTRRRGPILFWFTLALILVTGGALGIADLAGANVADAAYPALALGVTGSMLVLGAFWGRAGGLILLGLLSAVILIGATAADQWGLDHHTRTMRYAPTSASAVMDSYFLDTGELTIDLSTVTDPAALAGREIEVGGHVGSIRVIAPHGIDIEATGLVHGPGRVDIFGASDSGVRSRSTGSVTWRGVAADPLTIDADLNVGEITMEMR